MTTMMAAAETSIAGAIPDLKIAASKRTGSEQGLDALLGVWAAIFQQQITPVEVKPELSGAQLSFAPVAAEPVVSEGEAAAPKLTVIPGVARQTQFVAEARIAPKVECAPAELVGPGAESEAGAQVALAPVAKKGSAAEIVAPIAPAATPTVEWTAGIELAVGAPVAVAAPVAVTAVKAAPVEPIAAPVPVAQRNPAPEAVSIAPPLTNLAAPLKTVVDLKRNVAQRLMGTPERIARAERAIAAEESPVPVGETKSDEEVPLVATTEWKDEAPVMPAKAEQTATAPQPKMEAAPTLDSPPVLEQRVTVEATSAPVTMPSPPPAPVEAPPAKPPEPVPATPRLAEPAPQLPQPAKEAKTISIRIPFTDAAGTGPRHIDLVFQNRNNDLTLQFHSPTAAIQQRIEDSMPGLLDKLQTADWSAKPADTGQSTPEAGLETRKRPDAAATFGPGMETARDVAGAAATAGQSGFRFDEQASNRKENTPQSNPGKNRKKERAWQFELDAQTEPTRSSS